MTHKDALRLIASYCALLQREGEQDETLAGLRDRFPDDGSEKKAMRWLGFIQGALYVRGRFSLRELKDHSRNKAVLS